MGAAAAAPSGAVHAWDRYDRMWVAMFHVALAVATVVALARLGPKPLDAAGLLLLVAVVAGARHLAARRLQGVEEESREHLVVGLAWAAATLPAMVVLVNAEEAFFFAMYGLFPQVFQMLPRKWAVAFAALIVPAVLVGARGASALRDWEFLVSVVGSAVLAPALGLFITAISRQSYERHEAILALQAAHEEAESVLQASLAISRARTGDEVAAAVGECLGGHGVDTVVLRAGGEPVARWATSDAKPAVTLEATSGEVTVEVAGPALSDAPRRTLETLATSCGLALANFALVEQARHTGVLEERARLAREIHDTLAQGFVSVLTQLEAAASALSRAPGEVVERVERAHDIARASLGEARRSVEALRPAALEAAPLPEALERVVGRWSEDAEVAAQVTVTGEPVPLPPGAEVTLLRATQEALANVARHAKASSVTVTLSFLGDDVVLDVHDDGRGFDPAAPRERSDGGFGLEALRQRVGASGGFFGLESELGQGTTLTVHLPVGAP
ncbi:MAG TPA: sensor histidine kinase [Acidimicrobiales bacterium]|nr:sensor histidine kinase [Acidimicrobiales bacterium]